MPKIFVQQTSAIFFAIGIATPKTLPNKSPWVDRPIDEDDDPPSLAMKHSVTQDDPPSFSTIKAVEYPILSVIILYVPILKAQINLESHI